MRTATILVSVLVAITATGFYLRAGKGGVEVHVGQDDDDAPRQVAEVTTTTTVTAPGAAAQPDPHADMLPADLRDQP